MVKFDKNTIEQLLKLYESRKIGLEGNIAKIIETDDENFKKYLENCIENDNENRRKRLNITKQVQAQNSQ